MYEYQADGTAFLQKYGRALLADDPGLGKSKMALEAAEGKTLIVAPAMVLAGGVWQDELAKWRPDLDATCVPYTSIIKRVKTGTTASSTKPLPMLQPQYVQHWDTVILDEVHNIKGRKTTWTRAIEKLHSDRLFELSGTPIENYAPELFVPLKLIHNAEAKGGGRYGSYWRWAGEWFKIYQMWGGQQVGKLRDDRTWQQFHDENFQGRFLQRLRDDVLGDLPPLTIQEILCPMSPAHRKVYNGIKKDFIAWTESGREIVAWNTAAQTTKLARILVDVSLVDPSAKRAGKFTVLKENLAGQAQPSLVVGHFRDTVRGASEVAESLKLRWAVLMGGMSDGAKGKAVRDFQEGRLDVLCATIDTVREGLTLTRADTVHRLERSWKPSRNEQVIRRIHRIGQERPVTVLDYITPDSVDERVLKVLLLKSDQAVAALRPRDLAKLLH